VTGTIRPYVADDLGDLLEVWYEASLVAHPFLSSEFLAAERRRIEEEWIVIAETMVCDVDGRLVGFLSLLGNEVGAIFVHPAFQRRGIGRSLMDRARAARPHLELDVFEANMAGRRFYEEYGFRVVGEHVHDETGQVEVRMRLD
jgi:putative acetyltransferase